MCQAAKGTVCVTVACPGRKSAPYTMPNCVDRICPTSKICFADGVCRNLRLAIPAKPQKFSHDAFVAIIEQTMTAVRQLSTIKGGEYAGDEDRLANFRRNAAEAETTMELIWRIYASKHWDAIMQYEKDLRQRKVRPRLEGLAGRADDLIVYLLLFKAMLEERGQK